MGVYISNEDNFRITIKQPAHKSGSTVTSTNPKTPSPNTLQVICKKINNYLLYSNLFIIKFKKR